MDGKFKIFSLEKLLSGKETLQEDYFVETAYGVMCAEYFNLNGQEYIVSGLDDGTV